MILIRAILILPQYVNKNGSHNYDDASNRRVYLCARY